MTCSSYLWASLFEMQVKSSAFQLGGAPKPVECAAISKLIEVNKNEVNEVVLMQLFFCLFFFF